LDIQALDSIQLNLPQTGHPLAANMLVFDCFPHKRVRLSAKKKESSSEIAETASFAALARSLSRRHR
jgi:hypothetical protein